MPNEMMGDAETDFEDMGWAIGGIDDVKYDVADCDGVAKEEDGEGVVMLEEDECGRS